MPRTIQEMSPAARLLMAFFAKMQIGEIVTWTTLAEVAGIDLSDEKTREIGKNKLRSRIYTALKAIRRPPHSMEFGCVIRVGLKRLDSAGIADAVGMDRSSIHRKSLRAMRKFENIGDIASLPADKRTRALADISCIGAIRQATTESTIKRLEVAAQKSQCRLPLDETLKAFA